MPLSLSVRILFHISYTQVFLLHISLLCDLFRTGGLVHSQHPLRHFGIVSSQRFLDIIPVEPANSTDHPLDGLLSRISPRLLPFKIHHDLCHHFREVEVSIFHLHSPLPPIHVGFTKYVMLFCTRRRNQGGTTRVLNQGISEQEEEQYRTTTKPWLWATGSSPQRMNNE